MNPCASTSVLHRNKPPPPPLPPSLPAPRGHVVYLYKANAARSSATISRLARAPYASYVAIYIVFPTKPN